MLFGLGSQLRQLAVPALLLLVTAGTSRSRWEVLALLLVVPYSLASVLRYVSFRYRYDETDLVIRTGLIQRNERHVPYARIQNLEAVQGVLHRLFGVVEVRVDTGGGQEPEATMRVLPVAALDEMRRRVFHARPTAGSAPAVAASDGLPVPTRTLLRLPPRELVVHGLIENRGLVIIGAAFGLVWELGVGDRLVGRTDDGGAGASAAHAFVRQWLDGLAPAWGRLVILTLAVAVGLLITRVLSVAWALIRLYGFAVRRTGDDLHMRYGLLTRVATMIPLRRVQLLTIGENLLHRACRRASVRVETAGGGAGAGRAERAWLAPIIRREDVPALVQEVLSDVDLARVTWRPAAPGAVARASKVPLLLAAVAAAALTSLLDVWALTVFPLLIVLALAHAHLRVRHLGWAVTDAAVLFKSGWVRRQVSIVRFARIQTVTLEESPFDRRTAMARVSVDTAGAGDQSHRVRIPYLPRDTALQLSRELATAAAATQFRW